MGGTAVAGTETTVDGGGRPRKTHDLFLLHSIVHVPYTVFYEHDCPKFSFFTDIDDSAPPPPPVGKAREATALYSNSGNSTTTTTKSAGAVGAAAPSSSSTGSNGALSGNPTLMSVDGRTLLMSMLQLRRCTGKDIDSRSFVELLCGTNRSLQTRVSSAMALLAKTRLRETVPGAARPHEVDEDDGDDDDEPRSGGGAAGRNKGPAAATQDDDSAVATVYYERVTAAPHGVARPSSAPHPSSPLPPPPPAPSEGYRTRYFTKRGTRLLLQRGDRLKPSSEGPASAVATIRVRKAGVLQKYVRPRGAQADVIIVTWSHGGTMLVQRRQNVHTIFDISKTLADRAATFDGPETLCEGAFLSPSTVAAIKASTRGIVSALERCGQPVDDSAGRAGHASWRVQLLRLCFRVDPQDRLWLLWCSTLSWMPGMRVPRRDFDSSVTLAAALGGPLASRGEEPQGDGGEGADGGDASLPSSPGRKRFAPASIHERAEQASLGTFGRAWFGETGDVVTSALSLGILDGQTGKLVGHGRLVGSGGRSAAAPSGKRSSLYSHVATASSDMEPENDRQEFPRMSAESQAKTALLASLTRAASRIHGSRWNDVCPSTRLTAAAGLVRVRSREELFRRLDAFGGAPAVADDHPFPGRSHCLAASSASATTSSPSSVAADPFRIDPIPNMCFEALVAREDAARAHRAHRSEANSKAAPLRGEVGDSPSGLKAGGLLLSGITESSNRASSRATLSASCDVRNYTSPVRVTPMLRATSTRATTPGDTHERRTSDSVDRSYGPSPATAGLGFASRSRLCRRP